MRPPAISVSLFDPSDCGLSNPPQIQHWENVDQHRSPVFHVLPNFYIHYTWLVVSTPLKNISQLGLLFPIYGKKRSKPPTRYKCDLTHYHHNSTRTKTKTMQWYPMTVPLNLMIPPMRFDVFCSGTLNPEAPEISHHSISWIPKAPQKPLVMLKFPEILPMTVKSIWLMVKSVLLMVQVSFEYRKQGIHLV